MFPSGEHLKVFLMRGLQQLAPRWWWEDLVSGSIFLDGALEVVVVLGKKLVVSKFSVG
jgi:hypothetical protein